MGVSVPIKLVGPAYLNVDPLSLEQGGSLLVNGYIDEQGALNGRPGLKAWKTIPHGTSGTIRGIHWWVEQQKLVVVVGNAAYALTSKTGDFAKISDVIAVDGSEPVTFSTNGVWLYITGGGHIYRWNGTTFALETDADCPTSSTHLAYLDGYIVANQKGTQLWSWSEAAVVASDPLDWNASSLSAESNPDPIQAVAVGWRELYLLGTRSVDVFVNDGNELSVFSRLDGALIEKGCIAPYSVQKVDNSLIWLDDSKRVVQLKDRTPTVISQAFDKIITNLTAPYDARSTIVDAGVRKFYLLTFPTNGRTFACDLSTGQWAEWAAWDATTETFSRYLGEFSLTIPEWGGMRLITSRVASETPMIYVLSCGLYTDNGALFRIIWRGNHRRHGTHNLKRSNGFSIMLKRGESDPVDSLGIYTSTGIPFSPDPGSVTEPVYGGATDSTTPVTVAGMPVDTVEEDLTVPVDGHTDIALSGLAGGVDYFSWLIGVSVGASDVYDVQIIDSVSGAVMYEYLNLEEDLSDNNYFLFTATSNPVLRITNRGESEISCSVEFKYSRTFTIS